MEQFWGSVRIPTGSDLSRAGSRQENSSIGSLQRHSQLLNRYVDKDGGISADTSIGANHGY